jgi:UDPglucose 6-dehydrogenase
LRINDAYNRTNSIRLLERLKRRIPSKGKTAVLGLSYKPFSHVVEESAGIFLCRALRESGYEVSAYDPLAAREAAKALGDSCVISAGMGECLSGADIVFVTTPDPAFTCLSPGQLSGGRDVYIVDFWRCLGNPVQTSPEIHYIPGGRCIEPETAGRRLAGLWNGTV